MTKPATQQSLLRQIPSVSDVLTACPDDLEVHHQVLTRMIQGELDILRQRIRSNQKIPFRKKADLIQHVVATVIRKSQSSLKPVINATGIVLHTGFGRAPIDSRLIKNIENKLAGYVNLEVDLDTGKRGERLDHMQPLLTGITGAEDGLVVNNNAAAVLLALNTLAENREVIVSRGQQVEIGGSFRMPDVIRKSHCRLKEVGTTNRTHLKDYEKAISENTGLLLWVHTSNYEVRGFTQQVRLEELVDLGHSHGIPVMADLGSGALIDLEMIGLPHEHSVQQVVETGVDVVTFSGDKLLGGPQAGIMVGQWEIMEKNHQNPMYRSLRCDKFILAFLEETLLTYGGKAVKKSNLALTLLSTKRPVLKRRAGKIMKALSREKTKQLGMAIVDSEVEAGSGSLPVNPIESVALECQPRDRSVEKLARDFRQTDPAVVGYIRDDKFYLDLKAVLPDQIPNLISVIKSI